jgi:hypothetical protein
MERGPYCREGCSYRVGRNPSGCRHLARSDAHVSRGHPIACAESLRVRSRRACSTGCRRPAVDPICKAGTVAFPDRIVPIALFWYLLPLRVRLSGQHPPSSTWECRDSCTLCTQCCDPRADRAGLSPLRSVRTRMASCVDGTKNADVHLYVYDAAWRRTGSTSSPSRTPGGDNTVTFEVKVAE